MEINAVSQFQANAGTAQKKTKKEKCFKAWSFNASSGNRRKNSSNNVGCDE